MNKLLCDIERKAFEKSIVIKSTLFLLLISRVILFVTNSRMLLPKTTL